MVEANSNYIIDIEILDKRHVGLASTNMEREAVKCGLERLTQDIKVAEFVTNASTSVKALLGMCNTVNTRTVYHFNPLYGNAPYFIILSLSNGKLFQCLTLDEGENVGYVMD